MNSYPKWFYLLLLFSAAALFITGLLLIPTALTMRLEQDVSWTLNGAQRLISASTHTSASYLLLIIAGALFPIHMKTGWRSKKGHKSGLTLVAILLGLLLTAVGLFYLGNPELLSASSILHIVLGLILFVIFIIHLIRSRLAKKRIRI